MEVTEIESIPLESAVGTVSMQGGKAAFEATVRPVLVRVHTDEGITGLGETYLDDPTGDKSQFTARAMDALGNHLVGEDPRNVTELWHEMYVHTKRSGSYRALSALDEALWDIKGKDAGKPVYELLGGSVGELEAYATFPHRKEADQLIEDADWLADKGFPMMKIVGGDGVEDDQERIATIAQNIPDDIGLAIDTNTSYDFTEALPVAKTASEYGLDWFEEPLPHTDFKGQGKLNDRVSVPISGYQNHVTHYPTIDHLRENALEIYQPALDYCGGITAAHKVATLVEAHDKVFVPHAFGPVVNYSASLHVAAACSACDLIEFGVYADDIDDPGRYIASPYIENQEDASVEDGGTISPPDAPGLGMRVDEAKLEEFRTD